MVDGVSARLSSLENESVSRKAGYSIFYPLQEWIGYGMADSGEEREWYDEVEIDNNLVSR